MEMSFLKKLKNPNRLTEYKRNPVWDKDEANANLVEPQIGHGLIGNSLFTFNNANKVFFASTQGKRRIKVKAEILR